VAGRSAGAVLPGAGDVAGSLHFVSMLRFARHLFSTRRSAGRRFSPAVLRDIESAIREVEARHSGEICFAVESALDVADLFRGMGPRQRALQVFRHLGVWDTERNNGVLIYVLLADRRVEIVADRGISNHISQSQWDAVCQTMRRSFAAGEFGPGSVAGVRAVGELLASHFPGQRRGGGELADQPVLL
jgi:uncharacterized membrane protein